MFSLRKESEKDFTKLISNEELRFHTKTLYGETHLKVFMFTFEQQLKLWKMECDLHGYRVQLSRVKDQCITQVAHPYSQKTKLL
jgi:hypothetical protein